jgi:DNA mismatch repair ATPase MutS
MQTIVNEAGDMVYLFQVQDGSATTSSSKFTASASGLPDFMIERAEQAS